MNARVGLVDAIYKWLEVGGVGPLYEARGFLDTLIQDELNKEVTEEIKVVDTETPKK